MPRKQPVWFILIIRITATLTVVMVWIIRRPRQRIGGVFNFREPLESCSCIDPERPLASTRYNQICLRRSQLDNTRPAPNRIRLFHSGAGTYEKQLIVKVPVFTGAFYSPNRYTGRLDFPSE